MQRGAPAPGLRVYEVASFRDWATWDKVVQGMNPGTLGVK
ncbi:unnamed protein product [Amoebophrya sp. A120]|nr:unnamed protein product [Amoebophrya sp. A120]|eukprot:GSA120T00003910001.1